MTKCNNVNVKIESEDDDIKVDFEDKIDINFLPIDHDTLNNLDYEHSGHTGFMPAKLSILPEVNKNVQNNRLVLSIFDTGDNKTGKISIDELSKRIIKISGANDEIIYKGQFIFKEIN